MLDGKFILLFFLNNGNFSLNGISDPYYSYFMKSKFFENDEKAHKITFVFMIIPLNLCDYFVLEIAFYLIFNFQNQIFQEM